MDKDKLTYFLVHTMGRAAEAIADDLFRVIGITCEAIEEAVAEDYKVTDKDYLIMTLTQGVLTILTAAAQNNDSPDEAKKFADATSLKIDQLFAPAEKPKKKGRKKNEPKQTLH